MVLSLIFKLKKLESLAIMTILVLGIACAHKIPKDYLVTMDAQVNKSSDHNHAEYQFADNEEIKLIAPGDLISISYNQDSKLNGRFRVSFDGYLKLPYALKEYVVGISFLDLSTLIRSKYTSMYKNVDEISIILSERKRWVQVVGDITLSGYRLIDINADITQILTPKETNLLPSTEERKKLKYLKIKWNDTIRIFDLKKYFNNEIAWADRKWHGGEILSFQSNVAPDDSEFPMIRVMGEVSDPGSFELESDKDFYSYILKAGGVKSTANLEHLYLIRGEQFKRKIYEFSFDEIADLGKPQANDTIVLFQDRASENERRLQMATSVASLLSALTIFGIVF
jgi:protein involved in polysaccharide export with SLBB domain